MSIDKYQETYIQQNFANRIGGANYGKDTAIYKFEKIKRAKAAAKQEHPNTELIDMGVGEPDEMADAGIVAKLAEEASKRENRGYADNGIPEFKEAAVRYLKNVFGVEGIDAATEVLHSIGSKPALAMLPSCFINPGDVTIMTVPGYPVLGTHTKYLGGEVYNVELKKENAFLPDLSSIPEDIARRAKLLYLNYPNNPTGASATVEFFSEVVEWARKYGVVVVHDAPYAALTYDGLKPLSFLSVPGAKDVGVELHSLSKSYNMTGWRIGFIAGNPLVVKAFGDVKDNNDSGQFIAIQKAAAYGLDNPQITEKIAEKYSRRHNMLVDVLNELGFTAEKPKGSFFLYVEAPKGVKGGRRFESGEDFSQYLIREKLISTVPWDDAGHFVRFSVTFIADGEEEEKRVISEIRSRLSDVEFEF
ncbi:pyridoxal phosphate-dependent aminotransferase [Paenibacillus glucanolyticus]|jgi:LL-diaminopimelate aminotransferase|uniref:LL-diaminopimelate aminotransferase n=1 Tax=Paenibacillus TaxID=44249 RepID=UPI0003E21524|nr:MULTISPECIES: LL-diaminopimelate aminotransferase [Paenibacillus]ANA81704.1 aspartate aminotransferase [Paenibacillus glucanolyticus]AVV59565.1 pyridoxal phosphate-dependent aminotransferase [Paenibacillus glucanolyticus]ETT42140.1 aspartate aminotransferase [Paenibacillus sp. FSL R5-808]MDH6672853.1 LL-diaminopimelate aminotransferase [Paenibacillus sp. LBL]MPY20535.1 LL-diaminopimelate aminotransferase [Paenibacillus glucanolyticus]